MEIDILAMLSPFYMTLVFLLASGTCTVHAGSPKCTDRYGCKSPFALVPSEESTADSKPAPLGLLSSPAHGRISLGASDRQSLFRGHPQRARFFVVLFWCETRFYLLFGGG